VPLRECQHIVLLLGYSVSNSNKTVSLVYEYHDSTLEESMKSSSLHSKPPSDRSLWALVEGIQSALKHLYSLGLNHLDMRPANILEQNKEALDINYKLLFTNYTVDAVIQLKNLDTNL
jgi:serine/threonine protein kinase